MNALRVLISSGASAGHLYPAFSLADYLKRKRPDIEIAFASTKRGGLESVINECGYRLFLISATSLSFGTLKLFRALYLLLKSFLESFFLIERYRPDVIIGFGSYVSFPVLLEGIFFKKKIIIHEQNVSLGLANSILSLFADRVAVSFRDTGNYASLKKKVVFTGNPLRENLKIQDRELAKRFFSLEDKFTILAVGGSQGSHKINLEFMKIIVLLERKLDFQFIHIAGKNDYADLQECYKNVKIKYRLFEFLPQMEYAYSLSDLVIARSGAGTISELAYFGKAAILIPYPYAGGHQLRNALALKSRDAACVIEEMNLGPALLVNNIISLMNSLERRQELANNIRQFANLDAAERLGDLVLSLAQ